MKLTDLTPEQKRIAIAEACGWTDLRLVPDCLQPQIQMLEGQNLGYFGTLGFYEVPDYLNDLNAMHEAEKIGLRNIDESALYYYWLEDIVGMIHSWHATAEQRADAFLLALNLASL